jgi:ABC-type Fe3+/spermidine/putrescine transport system ATPase subunit
MARLEIDNLSKSFGRNEVLKGLSIDIPDGSFISLLGPSGCGKSTLMRLVAGLEQASAGSIRIDGEDVTALAPEHRHVALMFQSYALFPHMTVAENVRFPLRMRNDGSAEDQKTRVAEALEMVQLGQFAERLPKQLSGGQQQRVALARAIVARPKVLLLDEPLSNLDARLREDMQIELIELHKRLGLTTVFVTHDQDEALSLSDSIILMRGGVIEQSGAPEDLYGKPATAFVADFMGASNVVDASVSGGRLTALGGLIDIPAGDAASATRIAIRQEHLRPVDPANAPDGWLVLPAERLTRVFLGSRARYRFRAGGEVLHALVPGDAIAMADTATALALDPADIRPLAG